MINHSQISILMNFVVCIVAQWALKVLALQENDGKKLSLIFQMVELKAKYLFENSYFLL